MQLSRKRNGAYAVSISRDLGDPEIWMERYHFPTWDEYLRQRDRMTKQERELQDQALAYHAGGSPVRARRFLERPYGSVRWTEESTDPGLDNILPMS